MEILCLGVLRVLGVLLMVWRKSVGRVLPGGRRMDQIIKIPPLLLAGGMAVLGVDRREDLLGLPLGSSRS